MIIKLKGKKNHATWDIAQFNASILLSGKLPIIQITDGHLSAALTEFFKTYVPPADNHHKYLREVMKGAAEQ